jgi:hypothetical protein
VRAVQLGDRLDAARQERLVHRRLVLEDLLLHREERVCGRPVGVDTGGRPPARAVDAGPLERPVQPVFLELVRGQWS